MNVIETKNAPGAIGPYSQGYAFGDLVITSGQIPVDPATGTTPEGISAQAEQSCKNVGAILEAAGSGFDKVVKTTWLPPMVQRSWVTTAGPCWSTIPCACSMR